MIEIKYPNKSPNPQPKSHSLNPENSSLHSLMRYSNLNILLFLVQARDSSEIPNYLSHFL